ncbi:conserved hypothetical protein [Candidatus Vesicomyidisocius calyptogenae]|uniref:Uncharacterized protein n=2 Tax=Vesicomyosocius okutanii subsp. Calyptogena okutanii (strain HA) TaxID=412965 RepID=A5CX98_VESOH|nr:conserved hypothetical protein [Candidatus Vesicomyosocius okutanii]
MLKKVKMPTHHQTQIDKIYSIEMILSVHLDDEYWVLYPLKNWQVWEEKISTLSLVNSHTKQLKRELINHTTNYELDKVVHILTPLTIKHYSHVDGKTIIGNQRHDFEVRNKNTWNKQFDYFDTISEINQNPIKLPNYHYDA